MKVFLGGGGGGLGGNMSVRLKRILMEVFKVEILVSCWTTSRKSFFLGGGGQTFVFFFCVLGRTALYDGKKILLFLVVEILANGLSAV